MIRFEDESDYARLNAWALVGMSSRSTEFDDAQRSRIATDIARKRRRSAGE